MVINKSDLASAHYLWDEDEMMKREDESPCRKTFDRTKGEHVLWLANWYVQRYPTFGINQVRELEVLIEEKLPRELRSEISVCHWILNTMGT